jgi:aerobic-type carbon monoxide dehydrogenase small subunit (CoxS/CutS family)
VKPPVVLVAALREISPTGIKKRCDQANAAPVLGAAHAAVPRTGDACDAGIATIERLCGEGEPMHPMQQAFYRQRSVPVRLWQGQNPVRGRLMSDLWKNSMG